jgi:hypothetical protein
LGLVLADPLVLKIVPKGSISALPVVLENIIRLINHKEPLIFLKKAHFSTVKGDYLIQPAMDHQDLDVLRKFIEHTAQIGFLKLRIRIGEV